MKLAFWKSITFLLLVLWLIFVPYLFLEEPLEFNTGLDRVMERFLDQRFVIPPSFDTSIKPDVTNAEPQTSHPKENTTPPPSPARVSPPPTLAPVTLPPAENEVPLPPPAKEQAETKPDETKLSETPTTYSQTQEEETFGKRELTKLDAVMQEDKSFKATYLFTGSPGIKTNFFFLTDPDIWVIELFGDWQNKVHQQMEWDKGLIRKINIGLHPDHLRLVFYLREQGVGRRTPPTINESKGTLSVTLSKKRNNPATGSENP